MKTAPRERPGQTGEPVKTRTERGSSVIGGLLWAVAVVVVLAAAAQTFFGVDATGAFNDAVAKVSELFGKDR